MYVLITHYSLGILNTLLIIFNFTLRQGKMHWFTCVY